MAERTQEWQDISTAPKDGTMIIIYPIRRRGGLFAGELFSSAAYWHQPGNPKSKGFWVPGWALKQYPTHWKPMLRAPIDMKADMDGENGNG